jgi:hypothetical protein
MIICLSQIVFVTSKSLSKTIRNGLAKSQDAFDLAVRLTSNDDNKMDIGKFCF